MTSRCKTSICDVPAVYVPVSDVALEFCVGPDVLLSAVLTEAWRSDRLQIATLVQYIHDEKFQKRATKGVRYTKGAEKLPTDVWMVSC